MLNEGSIKSQIIGEGSEEKRVNEKSAAETIEIVVEEEMMPAESETRKRRTETKSKLISKRKEIKTMAEGKSFKWIATQGRPCGTNNESRPRQLDEFPLHDRCACNWRFLYSAGLGYTAFSASPMMTE